MAGNGQLVQGGGEVAGGSLEMSVTDAQAMMGTGDIGSPVVLGTTQRLAQDRHKIGPVPGSDAAGEERGERRVGQQPPVESVNGSGNGGPAADRLIKADRLRVGG